MTRWRWKRDPHLGFPAPALRIHNREYDDEDELDEFDRRHAVRKGSQRVA